MKRNSMIGMGVALCIPAMVWPVVQKVSQSQNSPLLSSSVVAQAQDGRQDRPREGRGNGRDGRGPGGGMGGPGGGFRRSEKMQIGRFIREIGDMERDKKTPLNKKQAQKIVSTIAPWRKKAGMSDADAKKLYAALRDTLTAAQKKMLDQPPAFGGPRGERPDGPPRGEGGKRPNGPPPGGGGRDGGGRNGGGLRGGDFKPPSEADMKKMQAFMASYNPLYPPTSYAQIKSLPQPLQEGMTRRYKELQDILAKLAAKK